MKKKIALVCAFVLVIALAVSGTYAYLTSSDQVKNTFTIGKVAITLDEAKVNEYGELARDAAGRVKANTYKLIPGNTYVKDPTVHVDPDSEACYIFVKVEDSITALEATKTVAEQIAEKRWTALADQAGVYYKTWATGDAVDLVVFDNFTIKADADVSVITANDGITVTAYAIQKAGLGDAATAWAALNPANP